MRFALLLAGAVMALTLSAAEARDGCGRGWFHNGRTCVQEDYDEPRYYQRPPRPYYDAPGYYRGGGGGGPGGPDCYRYHGRQICCPRRWTVQDGVCKPYRGG